MKKRVTIILLLAILASLCSVQAYAMGQKTLEVTLTGYSLLYQMCMEALGQETSIKREWIDENTAMLQLTDTCICHLTTESQSDFANITEVLHTAAPESSSDMLSARCSMVSTILAFDPDLDADTVTNMVMNILPEKGEYTSDYCQYKYVQSYNIYMLYISPK